MDSRYFDSHICFISQKYGGRPLMATWAEKGYVSDSEEDSNIHILTRRIQPILREQATFDPHGKDTVKDVSFSKVADIESLYQTTSSFAAQASSKHDDTFESRGREPYQSSTAAELEKSLSQGLDIVHEARTLARGGSSNRSMSESPLSSPPLSPRPSELPAPAVADLVEASNLQIDTFSTRTFRQRRAIQKNPYSLEQALYLQHCRDRGIKPVNLPRQISPVRTTKQQETQTTESSLTDKESWSEDISIYDIPIQENASLSLKPLPGEGSELQRMELDNDDELPDLSLLLRKTPAHQRRSIPGQALASRLSHAPPESFLSLYSDSDAGTADETELRSKPPNKGLNSLPSPPFSSELHLDVSFTPKLASVRVKSSGRSPTPQRSSTAKPRKRPIIHDDDSQSLPDETMPAQVVIPSESEEEPARDEVLIRRMQKRVKGVLPASWLSIDRLQRQITESSKTSKKNADTRADAGVAVVKHSARSLSAPVRHTGFDLYADLMSSQSEDESILGQQADTTAADGLLPSTLKAVEVTRDNGFDYMLAPRSRTNHPKSDQNKSLAHFRQGSSTGPKQRSRGQRAPKRQAVELSNVVSVFDAPGLSPRADPPRQGFLKLAARIARKHSSKAGQSAAQKFIQLENDEETSDILTDFYRRSRTDKRRPLQRMSGNRDQIRSKRPTTSRSKGPVHRSVDHDDAKRRDTPTPTDVDNGHVAHCDDSGADVPAEIHEQRLTLLRSLAPLVNRAGQGRLATNTTALRDAQIEVPSLLSKRKITRAVSQRLRLPDSHRQIVARKLSRGLDATEVSYHRPRAKKKQIPVPTRPLRQTRIVNDGPDTHGLKAIIGKTPAMVKGILEKEFLKYHAAWFQGSRSSLNYSNLSTQTHFHAFLEVLQWYLPQALQDAEDHKSTRDIRTFMHRLIPNRGQIGARGEVGNKHLDVSQHEITIAQNVFDLHACLLNLAPGSAPRPRVLEPKVDFADAHHEICLVAISAWSAIAEQHHADSSITKELGSWITCMIEQLIKRWKSAEVDAWDEARISARHCSNDLIRTVIRLNRETTCTLLTRVFGSLSAAITAAVSQTEADSLFDIQFYQGTMETLCRLDELDTSVPLVLIGVLGSWVNQRWQSSSSISSLLSIARNATTDLTANAHVAISTTRLLAETYFTLFRLGVLYGQRQWVEISSPASSLCPDIFVAVESLPIFKSRFFALFVEHEPQEYGIEYRKTVISHWLALVFGLATKKDKEGLFDLTKALLIYDSSSFALGSIRDDFVNVAEITCDQLHERLDELRHSVVTHAIPYVHHHAHLAWTGGALEDDELLALINDMFKFMRHTWCALADDKEAQSDYTVLIHTALERLERYPCPEFVLDPWFTDGVELPQPQKHPLLKILSGTMGNTAEATHEALRAFRQDLDSASTSNTLDNLEAELKLALIDCHRGQLEGVITELHFDFVSYLLEATVDVDEGLNMSARNMLFRVVKTYCQRLEAFTNERTFSSNAKFTQMLKTLVGVCASKAPEEAAGVRALLFEIAKIATTWLVAADIDVVEEVGNHITGLCEIAAIDGSQEGMEYLRVVMSLGQ